MRAYERFLNYIQYDTASDEASESCPSTEKQLVLARALVEELKGLGVADARVTATATSTAASPPRRRGCPPSG